MKNKKSAFSLLEASIVMLVVGLIIAGVAGGSKLIRDSRLQSARALSQASVVSGLEGLVFWLDATADGVYTNSNDFWKISNGERVKTIKDNNSKNLIFTFSEISSGGGPTYVTKGIGGLPTLFFNGNATGTTGDCLQTPFVPKIDPVNLTFFIVLQPLLTQTASVISVYSNNNPSSSSGKFRLFKYYVSATSYWDISVGATLPPIDSSSNAVTLGTPTVLSFIHNEPPASATTVNKLYDRTSLAFSASASHTVNESTTGYTYVGCRYFSSTYEQFFNGYVSEIILYNRALPDEDRAEIVRYLMQKYNIR